MKELLLGIDIGTSACKVAVFNKNGEVVSSASGNYQVFRPQDGYAEQAPDDWWQAVCEATQASIAAGDINPANIAGIGIAGQSWSAIAIDKSGNVLTRTPIWMDTRATAICDRLNQELGSEAIVELSGNSLTAPYVTGKILWYQENLPDIYKRTDKILQSNSFIAYRLTGKVSQDVCQSYAYHCFDMRNGRWDSDMRKAIGIPEQLLPEISPCHAVIGTVTKAAARQCGLIEGIPVTAGGLDAACGALGVGVLDSGETQEQGGQAGGMSICMDTFKSDPRLILGYHVVPDRWLLQGGTTGGGGVMRWLERELADYERLKGETSGKSSLVQLNEIAAEVSPGSDGLIFLPYMAGERTPIWDPQAKGVYYGLDFGKTKGHLIRAAMEGVAFSLRHNLEVAESVGAYAKELRSMGGSANSRLWTQIKSDITGKPIIVPDSDMATTLGAAILAGVGTGVYKDFREAVDTTVTIKRAHQPNRDVKGSYDNNYGMYLGLYENLKTMMQKSGGI